jgi:hypothetical protein
MSENLRRVPVGTALHGDVGMCLACGAELPRVEAPGLAGTCSSCGSATTLPPTAPYGPGPGIGTLHLRRGGLRKRWAMVLDHGPAESVLLSHKSLTTVVATGELPPASMPPGSEPGTPRLGSPIGRILHHAVQVERGALSLPWTCEQLLEHAFARLVSMPWAARAVALDALELGRPDLLARCGLSPTEATWLALVDAARHGDCASVVNAVVALPPDRYRRKIAVVAALLEQVRRVPGAATQLAPALQAFAESEPLAVVAQRSLGLVGCTARQRVEDLIVRAGAFPAPVEITQVLSGRDVSRADVRSRALLGSRGRLMALYSAEEPDPELAASVDLSEAPLAVLDDLIDAGKLTDLTACASGRSATERTYLTGRLQPERLSEAQVDELGHCDESIRRAFLAGSTELAADDLDRPLARHVAMVDALLRKRPQDLVVEQVLPAHRDVACRLADMIRGVESGGEPAALLQESLLADHSVWLSLVRLFGTERLRSANHELVRRFSDFFEWLDLTAAREHLFLADWRRAIDAARRCLDLAVAEPVRDEAQNLLACGLHNLGDHPGALRELEQAIEGKYSVALLANIGVVAARLDPELAALHLGRIVREGPTVTMRANAARQALVVWQSDNTKIWEGESDEQLSLPTVLREPLRSIVTESIELDEFRMIVAAMARFDADWLRMPGSLRGSPHQDSLEAKYYVARAAGDMFLSAVDVLGTVYDWDTAPGWLRDARDDLVRQTLEFLLDHLDDPDNTAGIIARALVSKVRGLGERDQVLLALLAVATITHHITQQDGEIADGVVELFELYQAKAGTLPAGDREVSSQLVELCVRRITVNLLLARQRELDSLTDPYNLALEILDRTARGTTIWFEARRQVAAAAEACQRTKAQLRPWLRRLEAPDVREMVMDFLESSAEFELKAQRVLRS